MVDRVERNRKVKVHAESGHTKALADWAEGDALAGIALASLADNTKPKKRVRQSSKPLMNALETEYSAKLQSDIPNKQFYPQAVTLRLANGVRLTPDFFCFSMTDDSGDVFPQAREVKGKHAWEDSLIKLKFAAAQWPEIQFILAWKDSSGQWCQQTILP